ncbi:NAD(P)-binding protein [Rickenella mellea]|uniref:NAD(P)-binding protein n=1 Tax=Rickenella mellea TaxID=50990 RepID=A0A4Y7PJX9_9AGAM|nr:NAD(P)-binding protein [Rickenella mellea]
MDLGLRDVHVLVTGASGGIGLETARTFLDQGARVTAHFNSNDSTLASLSQKYGHGRIRIAQANLSDETNVLRMFDDLSRADGFGHVQVLVVNHGIWPSTDVPLAHMTLDQWNSTLSANLTSSFLVTREFLRRLEAPDMTEAQKDKVAIVLVGSTAGRYGEAGHADYAVSKSAMMYGLLLSLKNEIVKIASRGRVNCVAPGWVRTPMAESALKNPDVVYQALATTPLKKVAIPSDVASQIVLLASPLVSGHVTGQVVMVEGGMEGRLLNFRNEISDA